ncbi:MAG TPA: hypothetical protein VNX23_17395 [Bradyrhizobium sp.]|jgi:hypothetical protein|uniref:hypothetical protein n=1 Tax=Bradyrhizobium sp. TaxID=376 RepID=UPI002B9813E0|nr:hypothetical protein [Bradyrhizobium sp.]HXB79153.1 hypothetical protein [Bradyrhizobium sp.]
MIRWGTILIGAWLLLDAAHAEDGTTKSHRAFAAICSAAVDGKPDIGLIATSVEMEAAGGMKDAAVTVGRSSIRVFNSSQTKQNIIITTTTYSDAQETECKSTVQVPALRAELESLAQSLKLEGGFFQSAAVITGRWKKPGNMPPVFVTMLSTASSTVLSMQRIDLAVSGPEMKRFLNAKIARIPLAGAPKSRNTVRIAEKVNSKCPS